MGSGARVDPEMIGPSVEGSPGSMVIPTRLIGKNSQGRRSAHCDSGSTTAHQTR